MTIINVLKERKFNTVVCIDDDHATPKIETIEAFADALVDAKPRKCRNLSASQPLLTTVCDTAIDDQETDPEAKKATVRNLLSALEDSGELTGDIIRASGDVLNQGHQGKTQRKLKSIFNDTEIKFEAFSFGQWQARKGEILVLADKDSRLLILVDENNENEPEIALNGQSLLADIFADEVRRSQYIDAIVVTSNCAIDGELNESHTIYTDIEGLLKSKGKPNSFKKVFVLAKERLDQQNLEGSFVMHLDRIEASRLSIELADMTKNALNLAVNESLDWLKQIPFIEFHNSVFESARSEGASEIDTLVRLASIRQRTSLDEILKNDKKFSECIGKMRQFTRDSFGEAVQSASENTLKLLRNSEFERPKEHINILKSPLACGDVFAIETIKADGTTNRVFAMLMANPCDLMIRADGTRKLTTGLLVQVDKLTVESANEKLKDKNVRPPLYYNLSTGTAANDTSYMFYNSKLEAIPLDVLDFCWTNVEGIATFSPSKVRSALKSFTLAQQKRISVIFEKAQSNRFSNIELWGEELAMNKTRCKSVQIGNTHLTKIVKYKVTREWRLAPEYSSAVLSTLAQSLSRPAFGHDYLKTD